MLAGHAGVAIIVAGDLNVEIPPNIPNISEPFAKGRPHTAEHYQRLDALLAFMRAFRLVASSTFRSSDACVCRGAALTTWFAWGDRAKRTGKQLDYVLASASTVANSGIHPEMLLHSDRRPFGVSFGRCSSNQTNDTSTRT